MQKFCCKSPTEHTSRCQTCKNVYAKCTHSDWASILHATIGGWDAVVKGPNKQCTLNKPPTELRSRYFVTKHQLSILVGAKCAKTCMQRLHIPTELPSCMPPLVAGCVRAVSNDLPFLFACSCYCWHALSVGAVGSCCHAQREGRWLLDNNVALCPPPRLPPKGRGELGIEWATKIF